MQPAHDHLPVAHVVFLDLRAFANAAQLHQRVAGVGLVLGADDRVMVGGREDAELDELRVGDEIEADEIGAPFFERRELPP